MKEICKVQALLHEKIEVVRIMENKKGRLFIELPGNKLYPVTLPYILMELQRKSYITIAYAELRTV